MSAKCGRAWLTTGAVLGGLAVALGAMAAHGLEGHFGRLYGEMPARNIGGLEVPASYKYLQDFRTAAEYQMYHALALVAVGLLMHLKSHRCLDIAAWCFVLGILLFSGSLFVLTLTGHTWLGMITPIGGTLMIVGWFSLAWGACPCADPADTPKT